MVDIGLVFVRSITWNDTVEVKSNRDGGLELGLWIDLDVGAELGFWIVLHGEMIVEGFVKAVEWLWRSEDFILFTWIWRLVGDKRIVGT